MHSSIANCDTFSNEEKVAAVVPVTSVEVTCYYRFIGLMCHNYALYFCFIYIYIYCTYSCKKELL